MSVLGKLIVVLTAFLAAFAFSFAMESSWAFVSVAGVALAVGFLARSPALLISGPVLGVVAYLGILGFVGQIGPLARDSVEGYGQVIVNSVTFLLVLSGLTLLAWAMGALYRRWNAARDARS